MKNSTMLTVSSLLSILLFSIHMAFDIVHGVERGDRGDLTGTVLIELVWLYAALLLAERRSGLIILLLGGILAVGVAALHMSPAGIGAKYAETGGAVFFFWSLLAAVVEQLVHRSLAALSFACISALISADAHAQSLLADKKDITGYAARKVIEACLAEAARDRYPIALAVVDSDGYLVSYQSTDGATGNTGVTAQLKAKTAAMPSRAT